MYQRRAKEITEEVKDSRAGYIYIDSPLKDTGDFDDDEFYVFLLRSRAK